MYSANFEIEMCRQQQQQQQQVYPQQQATTAVVEAVDHHFQPRLSSTTTTIDGNTAKIATHSPQKLVKKKNLSNRIRYQIVDLWQRGNAIATICERLRLKKSTVNNVVMIFRKENRVERKPKGGQHGRKMTTEIAAAVRAWVDDNVRVTLDELRRRIAARFRLNISVSTIDKTINAFHYTIRPLLSPNQANFDDDHNNANNIRRLFAKSNDRADRIVFVYELSFQIAIRARYAKHTIDANKAVTYLTTGNFRALQFAFAKRFAIVQSGADDDDDDDQFGVHHFVRQLIRKIELSTENETDDGNYLFVIVSTAEENDKSAEIESLRSIIECAGHRLCRLSTSVFGFGCGENLSNPIETIFREWIEIIKRQQPTDERRLLDAIHRTTYEIDAQRCSHYFDQLFDRFFRRSSQSLSSSPPILPLSSALVS